MQIDTNEIAPDYQAAARSQGKRPEPENDRTRHQSHTTITSDTRTRQIPHAPFCNADHTLKSLRRTSNPNRSEALQKPIHCDSTPLGNRISLPNLITQQRGDFRLRTNPRQAHVAEVLISINRNRRLAEVLSSRTCQQQPRNSRLQEKHSATQPSRSHDDC